MKSLPYVSALIAIVVIVSELAYVGTDSTLAWTIIGLAVAVALNALVLFDEKK